MPGPGIDSKPGYYLTVVTVVCGIYVGPNWHLGSAQHSVEFTLHLQVWNWQQSSHILTYSFKQNVYHYFQQIY